MENLVVRADAENRYSWDQIRSTYVDGVISDRLVRYDNGTTAQTSFMDGVRFRMEQTDSQLEGGVKTWDGIETFYGPDGSVAGRVTMFDNGVIKEESFQSGIRSQVAHYDSPQFAGIAGAKPWDSIVAYYDAAGQMAGRITTLDNGIVREESFANGVRVHLRQTDTAPGDAGAGVKLWDTIDTYYDANGDMAARLTQYDTGIVREEEFDAGTRTRLVQMDNPEDAFGTGVKAWDRIETYYDEDGLIGARITTYDDGRVRQDSFENGVRTSTEIQDNAFGSGESQYAWTAINISYDQNGKIAEKSTIYDDGRVRQDRYEDGVRTETTIEDRFLFNGGNYDWDTQHLEFAADGSIVSRDVSYDDGDAVQTIYEDGVLVARSEFDGDGSEAWLGRMTTFDEEGAVVSRQTYASQSELPEDFFVNMSVPVYFVATPRFFRRNMAFVLALL